LKSLTEVTHLDMKTGVIMSLIFMNPMVEFFFFSLISETVNKVLIEDG